MTQDTPIPAQQTISPEYAAELGRAIDELEEENAQLRAQVGRTPDHEKPSPDVKLRSAVVDYLNFLRRSVNVGPLTKNPTKETALLRRMMELIAAPDAEIEALAITSPNRCTCAVIVNPDIPHARFCPLYEAK